MTSNTHSLTTATITMFIHNKHFLLMHVFVGYRYWIGRALHVVKVHDKAGSVAGSGGRVRFDVGDCEVAVEWFQRDISGGDERRVFKLWAPQGETDSGSVHTFNSTELRLISLPHGLVSPRSAIHLEMQPLPLVGNAPLNIVQRTIAGTSRSSTRLGCLPRPNYRNVVYHASTTRAEPVQQLWEISAGSERAVLENCF